MSLAETFNQLGQDIMPQVAAAVFPNLMDILDETTTKDTGGAIIKTTASATYTNIPAGYKKNRSGIRLTIGDRAVSQGNVVLMFPVYKNGVRINLNSGQKLKILARGLEPVKIFSIVDIFDNQGVFYEVEAKKES